MIPLEDFFRKPERARPRLSPDGRSIAYLAPFKRRLNLFVRELPDGEEKRLTEATERDLTGFAWVSDEFLMYARDTGGDENTRLFAVARTGGDTRDLTPFENVKCDLVDDLEDDPQHVLFQMNRRDARLFDVYRLHVASGTFEMVAENPGTIQQWITDHAGRVRAAVTTDGVNSAILYRDEEADDWREVASYSYRESVQPLFFDFDDALLIAASNVGRDKRAVVRFDPRSAKETEVLYEREHVDVGRALWSRKRRRLTGFVYEEDKVEIHFIDETRKRLQDKLEARFPGLEVTIVSTDREELRNLVHVGSDTDRGEYGLYDSASDRWTGLFRTAPWLDTCELAPMEPIRYESRDGLAIHGYLTRPKEGTAPYPLIVHPHGGPWHRDSWGFNPEVQFLADRGYAVLQMNFRGSTGYGRKFWEASFGEWGKAMQDDVTDGVRWAIEEGHAVADRIAIYGGSYGGYATLAGLVREPDLFRCGISYVGVSNLFTWLAAFPPYWEPFLEMVHEMVGHPERDAVRLRETSPFFQADRIRVPLFVAQGANDPRVKKEESDQIVAALRDREIPTTYLVKDNEGHGFSNEENVFEFYRALESFLKQHMTVRSEEPGPATSPVG